MSNKRINKKRKKKMIQDQLSKLRREQSLENLKNIGNTCRTRIFQSKKDKANDPKRQRKQKDWE
jgi:hypothetical protein